MQAHRILILTNRIPYPLTDGGNMAMDAMIKGYHNAGWQVYLLAMHTSRHAVAPGVLKSLYTDLTGFETVAVDNDIKPLPTLFNFLFSKEPNHAARFFDKAYLHKLQQVIADFQPDAIQFESIFLATYLPFIRQATNAICIARLHNIEYQVWARLAAQVSSLPKRIYLGNLAKRIQRFEEKAWREFDILLPITDVDADIIKQSGAGTAITVAPFGIQVEEQANVQQEEEWVGYHIGAMDWLPNAEAIDWFLREVWPALHREVPDFRFYFAGRNMPQRFKGLSLQGVTCAGEVPDASPFIAGKKILIVPLMSGGGIRVKILEAMAKAKVIVSTAVGMQGINAIPGVHYLEANDAPGFVAAIKWIMNNHTGAEQMGQDARLLVERQYMQSVIMKMVIHDIERHME